MMKVITISQEFDNSEKTVGQSSKRIDSGFFGIKKAVTWIVDEVGGTMENE